MDLCAQVGCPETIDLTKGFLDSWASADCPGLAVAIIHNRNRPCKECYCAIIFRGREQVDRVCAIQIGDLLDDLLIRYPDLKPPEDAFVIKLYRPRLDP